MGDIKKKPDVVSRELTEEEKLAQRKDRDNRIDSILSTIESIKRNISAYEFLKEKPELALISTDSKIFNDFLNYIRDNHKYYGETDKQPIYCNSAAKDKFLSDLINRKQLQIENFRQTIKTLI